MARVYVDGDPDPGDVQWYYSAANTAAQCVSDVPGKADFVKFCDGDSLLLESIYRKNAKHYDEQWWQQHGDIKIAAKNKPESAAALDEVQADLEPRGPVVRSGYYEADIAQRRMCPVYWPEVPRMIMRGTWFVQAPGQQNTLIPLPHSMASKLEEAWQQKKFDSTQMTSDHKPQPDGTYGTRIELSGLLDSSYYAIFTDRNNMVLCTKDSHSVLKTLAPFKSAGARLHRGYDAAVEREPSSKKDQTEQQDLNSFEARTVGMAVRHVVLAVHGIGQRMGGRTIADDAQAVRRRVNAMLDDYMPDEIGKGYIQVLPIQWRKNLDLEADQVADSIMPEGARSFRQLAHNTCVEVLMYMSPSHAQNILDSVATNLNATYLRFVRRHGEFSGRISILAYSLGSVLCYDLLAHQPVPRESAPAHAFQHLAALHQRAQQERHRWQEDAATAELDGLCTEDGSEAPPQSLGDAGEKGSARSRWLSYWGLLKKTVPGGASPASTHRRPADGMERGQSLQSAASDDDPVAKILDDAAASMQADAAMWQSHVKAGGVQAGEGREPYGDAGQKSGLSGKREGSGDVEHKGFPPQRWLGKLARKIGQVRSKGRQSWSEPQAEAEPVEGPGQQVMSQGVSANGVEGGRPDMADVHGRAEPGSPASDRSRNASRDDGHTDVSKDEVAARDLCRPRSSAVEPAEGPGDCADRSHDRRDAIAPDTQARAGSAAQPGQPETPESTSGCIRGTDAGRASDAGAPEEAHAAARDTAELPANDLSSQCLSDGNSWEQTSTGAAIEAQLQQKLDALRAQAAATESQIAELQAQLAQPVSRAPSVGVAHPSDGLGETRAAEAPLRRSGSSLCLPAEAPHSMDPERSMGLPPEAEGFHTYGMGQVHKVPEAGSPLLQQSGGGPDTQGVSEERAAQARLLWPGSTLHELDAKQQQPLTMQSLQYPELCFLVDNFIMIGSPAGLFAALRGVNPTKGRPLGSPASGMLYPGSAPGGLPVCRRMYNVFHPFDPVAYRLEPLIQKDGCPRPQLVPYHRGGRKLKVNIVDAGENVAKTMDKVAAAFTFSFRRSKEESSEPEEEHIDYQQCSVAPYLLGLPLLTSLPDELPPEAPHPTTALIPPPNHSIASGEVTVRSAPEAWRAADSPRCMVTLPTCLSSSSETLVRMLPDLLDDTDGGSILSCTLDGSVAATPDSPSTRVMYHTYAASWKSSSLRRVSHSSAALRALQHCTSANGGYAPVPPFESANLTTSAPRLGSGPDPASARVVRNTADAAPKKTKRVLAGAGQGGVCPQGQGGSVGRLDFQLQEDFVETQFFGAFRAHFCYWKHEDVALLVCRAACGYDVVDGSQESVEAGR